jgi:hypothetical protein
LAAPGGRETPNNLSSPIGPAPWAVNSGPSTRRLIDFADAGKALGINPVGQSCVAFDRHYADQSVRFVTGGYVPQRLGEAARRDHRGGAGHAFEHETTVNAKPVTGSDDQVGTNNGTRESRIRGDNVRNYRARVKRID